MLPNDMSPFLGSLQVAIFRPSFSESLFENGPNGRLSNWRPTYLLPACLPIHLRVYLRIRLRTYLLRICPRTYLLGNICLVRWKSMR